MACAGQDADGTRSARLWQESVDLVSSILGKWLSPGEWSVFAAIVGTWDATPAVGGGAGGRGGSSGSTEPSEYSTCVLSVATGTKCVGRDGRDPEGHTLHDSHAEVLARRGFQRVLEAELCGDRAPGCPPLLERNGAHSTVKVGSPQFRIRHGVRLYLVTSEAPCGDAALVPRAAPADAELPAAKRARTEAVEEIARPRAVAWSGAKPAAELSTPEVGSGGPIQRSERSHQATGVLRTKSGRSDLPAHRRTTSHSCSDKIARWSVLGLQGALLSRLVEPIVLAGVVVGVEGGETMDAAELDARRSALRRAIWRRASSVTGLPGGYGTPGRTQLLDVVPARGWAHGRVATATRLKAGEQESLRDGNATGGTTQQAEKKGKRKKKQKKIPAAAVCVNWSACDAPPPDGLEVTLGTSGLRQGANKRMARAKTRSRLCRTVRYRAFLDALSAVRRADSAESEPSEPSRCPCRGQSYAWWRLGSDGYATARGAVLSAKPFSGWLVSSDFDRVLCPLCGTSADPTAEAAGGGAGAGVTST